MPEQKTVRGLFQLAKGGGMVNGIFIPDTLLDDVDRYNGKTVELVGEVGVVYGQAQPENPEVEGYVQTFEGSRSELTRLESIRVVE